MSDRCQNDGDDVAAFMAEDEEEMARLWGWRHSRPISVHLFPMPTIWPTGLQMREATETPSRKGLGLHPAWQGWPFAMGHPKAGQS